ncbi:PEP-CTERM protein-sorting domain-containing protein [Methylomagnum ishizawai]|uniref:PEP-CTERM protein-sorting domain-containing protein n=2 Tax=Methylomagnum ishizawai TaxID=1760988 RepID=A0A1Y6D0A8_9GAMM|nr:PEP-CTERM protein-sorting domain-containing protein [Methylomagnum ishizawai]
MKNPSLFHLAGLLLAMAAASGAQAGLVNGDFESNGGFGSSSATGWTLDGSATAYILDTTADDSTSNPYNIWGPDNGVNNGFTGSTNSGFFLGLQSDVGTAGISQTINGLTVGNQYALAFEWAAAQLSAASGATTQSISVDFGSDSTNVSTFNASQGFSGWLSVNATFTAASTSQTLSFIATGSSGLGPLTLIDGISLTDITPPPPSATPEPGSLALLAIGAVSVLTRSRRGKPLELAA